MQVDLKNYAWTEGFSCRKEAALSIGLFPTDTPLPYCGGEDVIFGFKLRDRFQKAVDESIMVSHYFPYTLRDFWINRWQRGWGVPVFKFFELKLPMYNVIAVTLAKTILRLFSLTLVFPHLLNVLKILKFSSKRAKDFLPFMTASAIEQVAMTLGEWKGIVDVIRHRKRRSILM
jgi:hypothetical protein